MQRLDLDVQSVVHEIYVLDRFAAMVQERQKDHGPRNGDEIDATWIADLVKRHGAIIAGSSMVSLYVGDSDKSIGDVNIFLPVPTTPLTYPHNLQAIVAQIRSAEQGIDRKDVPDWAVEHLARYIPTLPPASPLHPIEIELWDRLPRASKACCKRHWRREWYHVGPGIKCFRRVSRSDVRWGPCGTDTFHPPSLLFEPPSHLWEHACKRMFEFGSLLISVIRVPMPNPTQDNMYTWIQDTMDIASCGDVCFDGSRLRVREHALLMRKWTYLRPCATTIFDLVSGESDPNTDLPILGEALQGESDEDAVPCQTSRIAKYLGLGWTFLNARQMRVVKRSNALL